jgi:DNA-directed RNA polymerase subunit RPC12/RpoP
MKFETKKDKYRKARGGYSRFLDIGCSACGQHIAYYQKDGFGSLKRMYLDRFVTAIDSPGLVCPSCGAKIGSKYIYAPEDRPAYLLNRGSFSKNIVKDK